MRIRQKKLLTKVLRLCSNLMRRMLCGIGRVPPVTIEYSISYQERLRDWPDDVAATPHQGKVPNPAKLHVSGDKEE
jgi:hypothetical protein